MTRRILAGAVGAALLALPGAAAAQRYVSLSFSQLGLNANQTTDIRADASGRVWVTTNQDVSAVLAGARAPFFPIRTSDGLRGDNVRAVTFGRVGTDENFFLGFGVPVGGVQWGRVLSTSGLSLGGSLVAGNADDDRNLVNALASDGTRAVWAATDGGLVEWDISGSAPALGTTFLSSVASISRVDVAPWATDRAAVAAADRELFVVRTDGATDPGRFDLLSDPVQELTFDPGGNLWVLTNRGARLGGDVVRYDAVSEDGPLLPPPGVSTRFNPSQRSVTSIAVDPFDGTVWLGTDLGAYFQTPQAGSLTQDLCGAADTPGVGCWSLDTASGSAQSERVDVVYADPSGNIWFGTSGNVGSGIKGRIVRLLSLNASQYLGDGASAVVTLEDLPTFAGNGNQDIATVEVSVGGAPQDVTAEEQPGDAGRFSFTIRLADFGAVPSADGTDVQVAYSFRDANDVERTLTALARWANKVKFEDDLWIGGPCFLRSLAP